MVFGSYEELKAAVESRRQAVLTLEVDLGGAYSEEYEDAKKELALAKGIKTLSGGGFLADNLEALEQKVADLKPEGDVVFVQYRKIPLEEWSLMINKGGNMTATEQYEKVLPKTFIAVYGTDPVRPDDLPEDAEWTPPAPLSEDASLLSSKSPNCILPGGGLNPVVTAFMAWQNSGGDVNIRPTKSGRVSP